MHGFKTITIKLLIEASLKQKLGLQYKPGDLKKERKKVNNL